MPLIQQIEALVFASDEPLSLPQLQELLCTEASLEGTKETTETALLEAIQSLQSRYIADSYAFELVKLGGGYQFVTKAVYAPVLAKLVQQRSRKRLSRGLLETLAIIAYEQPVTRHYVEQLRGVQSGYALERLLERQLICILGREEGPGRALHYGTTPQFMDFFGINDLSELPTLGELVPDDTPATNETSAVPLEKAAE